MLNWLRTRLVTKSTLASPGADLMALFAPWGPTSSGVAVSAEAALRVPAVACAVRVIAEAVAQLPVIVYQRGAGGARERAVDHPVYRLLHDDVSPWQSSYDFRLQVQTDALLHGNGYGFANRVSGVIREVVYVCPSDMTVTRNADDGGPDYKIANRPVARDQVLHIRGLSTNGLTGKAAIDLAREAIGIALAQERHAGRLFGSGGRPSGLLKVPGKLGAEAVARISAAWSSAHGGENAGKTAILEDGVAFEPLTFASTDLQFLELRKHQVEEIARAFRVPPHLLFELGRATWSNAEEMGRAFVAYTLMPWLEQWQGAFRRCLFTRDERGQYFAEFMLDEFNRADTAKRSDSYAKMIAARVLNPNEVRAMENLPPYSGGDEFFNPNVATSSTGGSPA
jgi:HK97 family phage portal protein